MDAAVLSSPLPQSSPPPPRRHRAQAGSLIHSGVSVRGFYAMHALGATVPLVVGVALFGWRAAASVGIVIGSAAIALLAWRNIGARGRQVQPAQALWMALLLGLMLPPHLASERIGEGETMRASPARASTGPVSPSPPLPLSPSAFPAWPILVAAGLAVVMLLWLLGDVGTGRVHPALYTYLLLVALFGSMLTPHWTLSRRHLASGDLLKAPPPPAVALPAEPWLDRQPAPGFDAAWTQPPSHWLVSYTRGERLPKRGRMPLDEMLRDRMPPLEDLVIAGQPAPVGSGSAIAVIVGGLFLLYRGVTDFRIPLLVLLSAYGAFLVLPVPTIVTDRTVQYTWLLPSHPDVMLGTAATFANYELTASPALFMAFFLATASNIRPLARRARVLYAILIGIATAAAQLYVSVAVGPYLAVAAVALLSPALDRWFRPRTLV